MSKEVRVIFPGRLALAMAMGLLLAARVASAQEKVTYVDHVRPLLANRCLNCHNADRLKGGLDLSDFSTAMAGGSGGAVLSPGDADGSTLLAVVMHKREPFMPPTGSPLSETEVDLIRRWIMGGALESATSAAPKPSAPLIAPSQPIAPTSPTAPAQKLVARYPLADVVASDRGGAVLDVALHPTRPLAAVAGQKQVLLLGGRRMELVGVLPFPRGFPNSIRFSPSGRLLIAGGGEGARSGGVAVWSATDGRLLGTVGDESDAVLAADIDPAEERIALGGPSRLVKVFSPADGKLQHRIDKHTDWVTAVAYSPDGVLLATADRGGNVHVWEADLPGAPGGDGGSLAVYLALASHPAAVTAISWRADSNLLATACEDGRVRWFEMNGGAKVKEWAAHEGGCLSVRFAPDGRSVTAGRDRHAKLWDANGTLVRGVGPMDDIALCGVLLAGAAASPEGERVLAGDWSGLLRSWSAADGKHLADAPTNPARLADQLAAATTARDASKSAHGKSVETHAAAQTAAATAAQQVVAAQSDVQTAQTAMASAEAAVKAAMLQVEVATRQRDETAARAAETAQGSVTAAAQVDATLAALKAAVEEDAKAQAALSQIATTQTATPATDPAAAAAAQSSLALKSAMQIADQAKAQRAATMEAESGARQFHATAETALAAAQAARASMENQTNVARAALEQAQARWVQADAAGKTAAAAASAAGQSEQSAAAELALAEARLAKWQAGEVRGRLDAARLALAAEEAKHQPVAESAAESALASKQAAMALDAIRAKLTNAPATQAEMSRAVDEADRALVTAQQRDAAARDGVVKQEKVVKAFADSVATLREQFALPASAASQPSAMQPVASQPSTSQPAVEVAGSAPAIAAVGDNVSGPMAAEAIAKADEALALLNRGLDEARAELVRAEQGVKAAQEAVVVARQRAAEAEAERAKLPGRIVELEAAVSSAQARANADAALAAEGKKPVDAARAAVVTLEAEYDQLIQRAAGAVEL